MNIRIPFNSTASKSVYFNRIIDKSNNPHGLSDFDDLERECPGIFNELRDAMKSAPLEKELFKCLCGHHTTNYTALSQDTEVQEYFRNKILEAMSNRDTFYEVIFVKHDEIDFKGPFVTLFVNVDIDKTLDEGGFTFRYAAAFGEERGL